MWVALCGMHSKDLNKEGIHARLNDVIGCGTRMSGRTAGGGPHCSQSLMNNHEVELIVLEVGERGCSEVENAEEGTEVSSNDSLASEIQVLEEE